MANPSIESQIQQRVEEFAAELSQLVRQAALEAVQEAISAGPGKVTRPAGAARRGRPARPARPAARKARGGGKRIRRSPEELGALQGDLVAYIAKHPGQRLEEIALGMNIDSKELKRPIQMLLEEKQLSKEGQRRGTKYFAKGAAKGAATAAPAKKAGRKKKASRKKTARK